jgi:hypothetical protein
MDYRDRELAVYSAAVDSVFAPQNIGLLSVKRLNKSHADAYLLNDGEGIEAVSSLLIPLKNPRKRPNHPRFRGRK